MPEEVKEETDKDLEWEKEIANQVSEFNDLFSPSDLRKKTHDPEDEKSGSVESLKEIVGEGEKDSAGEADEEEGSAEEEVEEEDGTDESEDGEGDEESEEEEEEGKEEEVEGDGDSEVEKKQTREEFLEEQNKALMEALNESAKGQIPIVQAPPPTAAPPSIEPPPSIEVPVSAGLPSTEELEDITSDPAKFMAFLNKRDAQADQRRAIKEANDKATLNVVDAFFAQDENTDVSVMRDLVIQEAAKLEALDPTKEVGAILIEASKNTRDKLKLVQAAQKSGTRNVKVPRAKGGKVRGRFANGTRTRRSTGTKGAQKKNTLADEIEELAAPSRAQ